MTETTLTPSRVWKQMSPDQRQRAARAFWSDEDVSDILADRAVNPLLRSYLWAYPAGLDWFVNLAEAGGPTSAVLAAAYREPLSPSDLAMLWPDATPIGGRQPL